MPKKHTQNLLPPPRRPHAREAFKYLTIPVPVHTALAKAARERGYRTREFAVEILKRALSLNEEE